MDLRTLHGDVEFGDQVKSVVTGKARQVNIFRKDQRDQDAHRDSDFLWRERRVSLGSCAFGGRRVVIFVPASDPRQDQNGDQSGSGEPCNRVLSFREDDEGGEQRSSGRAGISAYLKKRLRQPVLSSGGQTRDS